MLTPSQIYSLRPRCAMLAGAGLLAHYSDVQLATLCNGLGAAWTDRVKVHGVSASDLIDQAMPWAVPASVIHDVRYAQGGTELDRADADDELLGNLRASIEEPWWRLRHWSKRWLAAGMYSLCRQWGSLAWTERRRGTITPSQPYDG